MFIRLTKVRTSENPLSPPGRWDEYQPGSAANTTSLPADYTMVGLLLTRITIGESVRLLRVQRNGVTVLGAFQSTPVVRLTDDGFATADSVYRIDVLAPQYARMELHACGQEYLLVF